MREKIRYVPFLGGEIWLKAAQTTPFTTFLLPLPPGHGMARPEGAGRGGGAASAGPSVRRRDGLAARTGTRTRGCREDQPGEEDRGESRRRADRRRPHRNARAPRQFGRDHQDRDPGDHEMDTPGPRLPGTTVRTVPP